MINELTKAEYRVAALAARGMTARAIAAELKVSVKTVQTHASNIYSKLGIKGKKCLPMTFVVAPPRCRANYASKFDMKFASLVNTKLSVKEAAEYFSCSCNTARFYLKKYNLLKSLI